MHTIFLAGINMTTGDSTFLRLAACITLPASVPDATTVLSVNERKATNFPSIFLSGTMQPCCADACCRVVSLWGGIVGDFTLNFLYLSPTITPFVAADNTKHLAALDLKLDVAQGPHNIGVVWKG